MNRCLSLIILSIQICLIPLTLAAHPTCQAVIFDLGGVVVAPDQNVVSDLIISTFHISKEQALTIVKEYKEAWIQGKSEKEFWEAYAKKNKRQLPPNWFEKWQTSLLHSLKEIPGTLEIIQELKSQGFIVAMLSNATGIQVEHIRKCGFYDLFNPAMTSHEIGIAKPNPRAFELMLEALNLPPSACIFIDDKEENVAAARTLGIDAIQFLNPEQLASSLKERGFSIRQNKFSTVTQMEEVFKRFDQADRNTLAIFDIDLVLIQPSDPAFQMANIKRYRSVAKKIMQEVPEEKQTLFLVLMGLSSPPLLLDHRLPNFLEALAERKIPLMALTANLTGALGEIENMEIHKTDLLKKLGIDFSKTNPSDRMIIFKDLPSYRENYSLYRQGVLFVNGTTCSKGEALKAFLQEISFFPNKIIFIDDREENLKSVETAIRQLGKPIDYEGIHFVGAEHSMVST